jgi:hypothetical protein
MLEVDQLELDIEDNEKLAPARVNSHHQQKLISDVAQARNTQIF